MIIQKLHEKKLITPPKWLPNNTVYETIVGSAAYGISGDTSDSDIYGICVPPKEIVFPHLNGKIIGYDNLEPFNQFQQHHLKDGEKEYDLTYYGLVSYIRLLRDCNPNIVDSIFVPLNCITHITKVGHMIRNQRRIFLHRGSFYRFKNYSIAQLKKIKTIDNIGDNQKRRELIEKHGYDCFDDKSTEFLTNTGWKKYSNISDVDLLGTINPQTGAMEYQKFTQRIKKKYTGIMYNISGNHHRCFVTENHRMLVSPAHRASGTTKYDEKKSDWSFIHLKDIFGKALPYKRTHFHIRTKATPRTEDYPVEDEYLMLAGLFLSEGTVMFWNGQTKNAAIVQTDQGKMDEVTELMEKINTIFPIKKYVYTKQTVWHVGRELAERIYADFGHHKDKRLPFWAFLLSWRQTKMLWDAWLVGDGCRVSNDVGDVIYSSVDKAISDLQAAMVASGHLCTLRGPYEHETSYGPCTIYQLYRPDNQDEVRHTGFLLKKENLPNLGNDPHTKHNVKNRPVVCFEVPNGTLITRNGGRISIQGNCKFGTHCIRLLNEIQQILNDHDLDLQQNKEQHKAIRNGEWTLEEIHEYVRVKEKELETLFLNSKLQNYPDEHKIKTLLMDCLEEHYGNISQALNICFVRNSKADETLAKIRELVQ